MNIWAVNKDINIKHLLLMLAEQFQDGQYVIIDNPMDDERAVRLANPAVTDIQLYVYTYGQEQDCYGVHIEYPNLQETNYNDTIDIRENVSFEQLVNLIMTHFDIPTGDGNNTRT